jgi:hypothetical protein
MNEIHILCIITYTIVLAVLYIFMEKRLNILNRANISKVPAEDNKALGILHSRLKILIRVMTLLLYVGGVFILITLM